MTEKIKRDWNALTRESWQEGYNLWQELVGVNIRKLPNPYWRWHGEFLQTHDTWIIEEYLKWCKKKYRLAEMHAIEVEHLSKSIEFQEWIKGNRTKLRITPRVMRGMSPREFQVWCHCFCPADSRLVEDVLTACRNHYLTPGWQDFLISWILFEDGAAGLRRLVNIVDGYYIDSRVRRLRLELFVDRYLSKDELWKGVEPVIEMCKIHLHGQPKFRKRVPDKHERDYLFYVLRNRQRLSIGEILDLLDRYRDEGEIDQAIREVYPDKSDADLRALLDKITRKGPFEDTIWTGVHRMVRRFGPNRVEVLPPRLEWSIEPPPTTGR